MKPETLEKQSAATAPAEAATALEQLALLKRFAPTLHFDALERWRPSLADAYLEGSTFRDENDAIVAGSPPALQAIAAHHKERKSRINPLQDGPGLDTQLRSNQMLAAYSTERDLSGAGACYGRVRPGSSGTLYLQYWLFYADNPCVLPPGRHDGDWEMVQLHLRSTPEGYESTHATIAGHGKPATRTFRSTAGGPDVYVAIDSHASYFAPGAHPMLPLSDVCDPGSPGAKPQVRQLLPLDEASWTFWWGRWGMEQGFGARLARRFRLIRIPSLVRRLKIGAGESPPSPGRQGASWDRPWRFQAHGTLRRGPIVTVQRIAHFIGKATWPRQMPAVRVERIAPGQYVIDAKPAGHLARRVSLVSVAFEELKADGTRCGLAMYSVRTGKPSEPLTILSQGEVRWRAAGYNLLRQRGEPGPAQSPTEPPWPLGLSGSSSDDQGARRVFAGALTNHLRRRGAAATEDLVGRLSWFWLRLDPTEVKEVVDASRREGYAAPLGQPKDAAGAPIEAAEWALTDRGRKLELTRALSLRDSIVAIRGIGKPVVSATEKWSKRIATALAIVAPTLALSLEASTSIAVIATGAILAIAANSSLRGETELRRAAEHWPRLRICRPHIHAWQTTAWKPWERLPIAGGALIYLIGSAIALRATDTWAFNVWIAIGIGVVAGLVAWRRFGPAWVRWYALNKAFRGEREAVRNLRHKTPDEPCAWGHACRVAREGQTQTCPSFGPDAPRQPDRVPAAP